MRISGINNFSIIGYKNNYRKENKNTSCPVKSYKEVNLNFNYYKNYFNLNFKGKTLDFEPVSSVKPAYGTTCSYNNIDEFAQEFEKKIKSQLMIPDISDIKKLVKDIELETGASRELILNVLFRLTQFSSYKSIDEIIKQLNENNLKISSRVSALTSNEVFSYILYNKFNFAKPESSNYMSPFSQEMLKEGEDSLVLDDMLLTTLEKAVENSTNIFDIEMNSKKDIQNYQATVDYKVIKDIKKFILFDGFDVKASDGNYYSASFLAGSGYLKSLAIDIITRVQKGQELDNILNSDLLKRFNEIYGNSKKNVVFIKIKPPKKITEKTILANLTPKTITKNKIKNCIEKQNVNYYSAEDENPDAKHNATKKIATKTTEIYQKALMKYLDEFCYVFSPDSFAFNLKQKGKKLKELEQNSKKENVYYIPIKDKSYGLMTYMFAKNNQIKSDNITTRYDTLQENDNIVIIDDASISGNSISAVQMHFPLYLGNEKFKSVNVYFSPILDCSKLKKGKGIEYSNCYCVPEINIKDLSDIAGNMDFKQLYSLEGRKYIKNITRNYLQIFSPEELMLLLGKTKFGYGMGTSVIAFPYMLPDNNSHIAGVLLSPLLFKQTTSSNKTLPYFN